MGKLAMVAITVIFIYIFYHSYALFTGYQWVKKSEKESGRRVEQVPLSPPAFYNFVPGDKNHPDVAKYKLFTFKEKKAKEENTPEQGAAGSKPAVGENYRVLGVVKKDKLFLVVRFNSDNKIRLISEGMRINDTFRVKRVTPRQVVVADNSGGERIHNIFQFEALKQVDLEKIKGKQEMKQRKERQKINKGAEKDDK